MTPTNPAGATKSAKLARVIAPVLAICLAAGALSACNTISGAGKDVSAAGGAVTGTSQATQEKLPDTPKP